MNQTGFRLFRPALKLAAGLVIALILAGCSGGSGSVSTNGQMKVMLTDASSVYSSVWVSIQQVVLVPPGQENSTTTAGMQVIATFSPPMSVDITTLNFAAQVLGQASVPAGTYHQIRLVLSPNPMSGPPVNYVTLVGGGSIQYALTTPSGQESGLKINGDFTIQAGTINTIMLDFNPDKAVVSAGASGSYNLKPTGISIVEVANSLTGFGTLSGMVGPIAAMSTAQVSAMASGSGTMVASGAVNPDDGSFRIFLPPGSYNLKVTASGYVTFNSTTPFTVVAGQDTAAGTITLLTGPI